MAEPSPTSGTFRRSSSRVTARSTRRSSWCSASATRRRPGVARAVASERASGGPSYRVTTVADLQAPQKTALHVALSAPALAKLGVQDDIIHDFSREFFVGMAGEAAEAEGRSRRLGNLGANAPAHWAWGGVGAAPDVLVMLYAEPGGLAAFLALVKGDLRGAFEVTQELATTHEETPAGDRVEPFGFIDGISQPTVDWKGERAPHGDQELYSNVVCAGEFLLGYETNTASEDRPLLEPERDPARLPRAGDGCPRHARPRAQRLVPRFPPAQSGRRGLLALRVRERPRAPGRVARGDDGGPAARDGRAAHEPRGPRHPPVSARAPARSRSRTGSPSTATRTGWPAP